MNTEHKRCVLGVPNCPLDHLPVWQEKSVSNPDPNSYIQSSAHFLAQTLSSKNEDYAPTGEFSNFEEAASFSGGSAFNVMLAQVAIKYSRIESLNSGVIGPANHESLRDSLLDLAGYAIIAHAYLDSVDFDANPGLIIGQ